MSFLGALALVMISVYGFPTPAADPPMIKPEAVPAYQPKYFPFEGGEKEVYLASWNGMIAVATAEVHTIPTVIDGKKVYQVRV